MAKYFKFIGIIELLGFVVGGIVLIANAMFPPNGASGLMFWLILVPYIIFAPAVGLLFFSYGSFLDDNRQSNSSANSASVIDSHSASYNPESITFSQVYFKDKSIDKIKKIVAIESFKECTKEEIDEMEGMTNDEINALYEKVFLNKAKPIVKELSDVSILNDMLKIDKTAYNLKLIDITDYDVKTTYISFKIYSTFYLILYSDSIEANRFFELIKESIKK